jgi:hypothetical protein
MSVKKEVSKDGKKVLLRETSGKNKGKLTGSVSIDSSVVPTAKDSSIPPLPAKKEDSVAKVKIFELSQGSEGIRGVPNVKSFLELKGDNSPPKVRRTGEGKNATFEIFSILHKDLYGSTDSEESKSILAVTRANLERRGIKNLRVDLHKGQFGGEPDGWGVTPRKNPSVTMTGWLPMSQNDIAAMKGIQTHTAERNRNDKLMEAMKDHQRRGTDRKDKNNMLADELEKQANRLRRM